MSQLFVRDNVYGALTFVTTESGRHHQQAHVDLAIENTLLVAQLHDK